MAGEERGRGERCSGRAPLGAAVAGAVSAGVGAALLLGVGETKPPVPGPPVLWVADRAANRLVALDVEDLEVDSIPVAAPRLLARRTDGGSWVVGDDPARGAEGRAGRLVLFDREGEVEWESAVGRVVDLIALPEGDAVLIEERPGGTALCRFDGGGEGRELQPWDGACCLAVAADALLVGSRARGVSLLRVGPRTGVVAVGLPGRAVHQVARGPEPGSWWALDATELGTVFLLDAGLEVRWARSCGVTEARMAPVPGRESVWVAGGAPLAVHRFGPGGSILVSVLELPPGGRVGGACARAEEVVLVVGGALLHLDAEGRLFRTQGGFGALDAVAFGGG